LPRLVATVSISSVGRAKLKRWYLLTILPHVSGDVAQGVEGFFGTGDVEVHVLAYIIYLQIYEKEASTTSVTT
jgi:hypothetical protein